MNLTDISLTADNREFVQEQLAAGTFPTPSDVVNNALCQARVREAQKKLAGLLAEGLESGPGIEVTNEWRQSERAKFLAKLPPGTAE
jgi:Arc/MetJ-type ribon-helix-helix transcriptional regulator